MSKILRAVERIAQPWKNGGGITSEVAISPPGAGLDDFDWRVSIAEVRAAGAFSTFENIDRILAILEGRMVLTFADRTVELDAACAPFAFAGDLACSGDPLGAKVTDLNVMTRRGRVTARVDRQTRCTLAKNCLAVALAPTLIGAVSLGRFDALVAGENLLLSGQAYIISFKQY